jgi:transposase
MAKGEKKLKQLQRRRLRAGRLLLKGVAQAEVARRVGVSRATVCEWNERLARGGLDALRRRPRGRPAGLDAAMRRELSQALKAGAMANGYATELWTLARVGRLIEQRFGLKYSASQVWRILSAMDWSCQRPSGRARERNEQAIRQWKRKRWPMLKKTPARRGVSSSSSTNRD